MGEFMSLVGFFRVDSLVLNLSLKITTLLFYLESLKNNKSLGVGKPVLELGLRIF